jgi:hypothetical protein
MNLRNNPFEIDEEEASAYFVKEKFDRIFLILPAIGMVSEYLKTFEEFPVRQRPASFSIDQAMERAQRQADDMAALATKS